MARVCVDSTYFDVTPGGLLTFKPESVGIQQLLVFDTVGSTAFMKASFPGLRKLRIRVIGGGGGGAGAEAAPGQSIARSSGSGGTYSESLLDASGIGASETITVGAGGTGAVGNIAGGNGGTSSFGGLVTAPGGLGSGTGMLSGTTEIFIPGTAAGAAGIGQISTPGQPGGPCHRLTGGSAFNFDGGGSGGGYGGGGSGLGFAGGNGLPGNGYGGGGVGAISYGFANTGGAGSRGAVLIELFF